MSGMLNSVIVNIISTTYVLTNIVIHNMSLDFIFGQGIFRNVGLY
jgi:hypothetical protein